MVRGSALRLPKTYMVVVAEAVKRSEEGGSNLRRRTAVAALTGLFRGLRCRCFVLSVLAPLAWSHPQYKKPTFLDLNAPLKF